MPTTSSPSSPRPALKPSTCTTPPTSTTPTSRLRSRSIEALRRLPADQRPRQTWGCEIWRGLDWLIDEDKGLLPTSARPNLQASLNGVFDSQIQGGKRYDLAVMGRRLANATFFESHAADSETGFTWAMDLGPLVRDETLDIADYTLGYVERLKLDIRNRINKFQ